LNAAEALVFSGLTFSSDLKDQNTLESDSPTPEVIDFVAERLFNKNQRSTHKQIQADKKELQKEV